MLHQMHLQYASNQEMPAFYVEVQTVFTLTQQLLSLIHICINTAQVLLTEIILADEESRVNALNTFNELFKLGAIPVVNENDSISTEEIKYVHTSVSYTHLIKKCQAGYIYGILRLI